MLRLVEHQVEAVAAGPAGLAGGVLRLDLEALERLATEDRRIASARVALAAPGDRTRVVNVLDVFDARRKEGGPTYPGLDGPPQPAGSGRLHRLSGFQIVATGLLPAGEGGLMVPRRAFIDFWGEGAARSPFADACTVVLDITLRPGMDDKAEADDAVRRALVRLSTAIGDLAVDLPPDRETEYPAAWERAAAAPDLPKVAYVYQIQSQGALVDTFLYGTALAGLHPTLLDPVEVLDGALVSGNHQRLPTPTFLHVNNPVLLRLAAEHGRTINLLPAVLMEGHQITTPAKERGAAHAVQLLRYLGADGIVCTQEGGGMSIVDQMLTIEKAAEAGIATVGVTYEMAGTDGEDRPLIHYTRAASHLVSTGNRDELVTLEAPDRVIGAAAIDEGAGYSSERSEQLDLTGAVEVPSWCVYGSISQVGGSRMRGIAA